MILRFHLILDLSRSRKNKERGESFRNELIQFCRFAAKILSDTQELRKFVFHAFLTFENTSFNKLTCRGRLTIFLDITGRRNEISGILFARTRYLHSETSHGVELSTNFEECVCFVRVWEKEKKNKERRITYTYTLYGSCTSLFTSRPGVQ